MRISNEVKILVTDIETAPLESYHWGLWDQNIGLEQIKTEWSILAYCAKWIGKKGLIYADTSGQKNLRDDSSLLLQLWKLLDEADIVVGQNIRRFDLKKIRARMVMKGMKPFSPVRVIDTLEIAKKHFGFTSNKLQWTSEHLTTTPKLIHKRFPGFLLWAECLKGNPAAWAEMQRYNKRDVVATEQYYFRVRPWVDNHPNLGVYSDEERPLCPNCGSSHVVKHSKRVSVKQQGKYQRYHCMSCGSFPRGKIMLLPLAKRRSLLVSE